MPVEILVINAGSSSIKTALYAKSTGEPALVWSGHVEGIGTPHPHASAKSAAKEVLFDQRWTGGEGPRNHTEAMKFVIERLSSGKPAGVGHRVVHGGAKFLEPARIDAATITYLESLIPLAPLHEPANLQGIAATSAAFPGVPQVACFDTAFHHGRPFVAEAFALPRELYDQGVRRYGFHGLSYEYIARVLPNVAPNIAKGRVVICHLGNGASMAAIHDGRCVDTTMGFTALEGLPMGTRCGQVDPGVLLYLFDEKKMTTAQVTDLLYKKSGLLGISGIGSDMRDLLESKDPRAQQAIDYFVYRIAGFVGSLAAALGGLDGLVFTAGIGEHAAAIRERVCKKLSWLGFDLDEAANAKHQTCITKPTSRLSAWVVPTNEELMIATHVADLLSV